jgi:hypothetical protein
MFSDVGPDRRWRGAYHGSQLHRRRSRLSQSPAARGSVFRPQRWHERLLKRRLLGGGHVGQQIQAGALPDLVEAPARKRHKRPSRTSPRSHSHASLPRAPSETVQTTSYGEPHGTIGMSRRAAAAAHKYSADNTPVKGFQRRRPSEQASPLPAPRVCSGADPCQVGVRGHGRRRRAIHALGHPREARKNLVDHAAGSWDRSDGSGTTRSSLRRFACDSPV